MTYKTGTDLVEEARTRIREIGAAADTLQQMGYSDVASLAGGFGAWVDAGGEIEE